MEMTKDFNFIKNILIALLLCFAVACTTTDKENNGNDSNNSNNGGNNNGDNGGNNNVDNGGNNNGDNGGKKYGSRMEALTALFDNTTLGTITLTISEDQWEQMISNTNNKKKDSYVRLILNIKKTELFIK